MKQLFLKFATILALSGAAIAHAQPGHLAGVS